MRGIANAAGVSLGSAYYYFAGKEHLIQAFYGQMQRTTSPRRGRCWSGSPTSPTGSAACSTSWVGVAAPYHEFAGTFFKNAAEPTSPLSPFSPSRRRPGTRASRSSPGCWWIRPQGRASLKPRLPELLWLLQMGVVLFWVHDRSPGSAAHAHARRRHRAARRQARRVSLACPSCAASSTTSSGCSTRCGARVAMAPSRLDRCAPWSSTSTTPWWTRPPPPGGQHRVGPDERPGRQRRGARAHVVGDRDAALPAIPAARAHLRRAASSARAGVPAAPRPRRRRRRGQGVPRVHRGLRGQMDLLPRCRPSPAPGPGGRT